MPDAAHIHRLYAACEAIKADIQDFEHRVLDQTALDFTQTAEQAMAGAARYLLETAKKAHEAEAQAMPSLENLRCISPRCGLFGATPIAPYCRDCPHRKGGG